MARHRDRLRPFENAYERRIYRELRQYGGLIAAQIENGTNPYTFIINGQILPKSGMQKIIRNLYDKTGAFFIGTTYRDLTRMKITAPKVDPSQWGMAMDKYFTNEASTKIVTIVKTQEDEIKGIIKSALTKGAEEGLGIDQISRNITKDLKGKEYALKSRFNAKRIARTEVNNAATMAKFEQANTVGHLLLKSWSETGVNTRPSHLNVRGQNGEKYIGMDELFVVGNSLMRAPGDSSGGVEEVVNCRCDLDFKRKN
jgi:hypothetical protein